LSPLDTKVEALILCGGLGTRLGGELPGLPKALAKVGGRVFLDILIDQLTRQGIRKIIFAIGYLGEKIISRYNSRNDGAFIFSREETPLGTGGAVQHALALIAGDTFLVLNGDSHCQVDFARLIGRHEHIASDMTMVVTSPDNREDTGTICLGPDDRILDYREKPGNAGTDSYVNAGVYVMGKRVFASGSFSPPFSLEYDLFPPLVRRGNCYGFPVNSELVDIGTPQRLREAVKKLS